MSTLTDIAIGATTLALGLFGFACLCALACSVRDLAQGRLRRWIHLETLSVIQRENWKRNQ
jgi:hypothetical protein